MADEVILPRSDQGKFQLTQQFKEPADRLKRPGLATPRSTARRLSASSSGLTFCQDVCDDVTVDDSMASRSGPAEAADGDAIDVAQAQAGRDEREGALGDVRDAREGGTEDQRAHVVSSGQLRGHPGAQ